MTVAEIYEAFCGSNGLANVVILVGVVWLTYLGVTRV